MGKIPLLKKRALSNHKYIDKNCWRPDIASFSKIINPTIRLIVINTRLQASAWGLIVFKPPLRADL